MLTIGDFSRYVDVSIRSLRHYDAINLFKPAYTDPETGYRYYLIDQLVDLYRVLNLKDLGWSLEEIKHWTQSEVSLDEQHQLITEKYQQISQRIEQDNRRLNELRVRLQQIESQSSATHPTILIKRIPRQQVISIRRILSTSHHVEALYDQLLDSLTSVGIAPKAGRLMGVCHVDRARQQNWQTGSYYALSNGEPVYYYERPGGAPTDFEACILLDTNAKLSKLQQYESTTIRHLPAIMQTATMLYQGNMTQRIHAMHQLDQWVERQGYQVCGPVREHYLRVFPDITRPDNLLEIQYPIQKRATAS